MSRREDIDSSIWDDDDWLALPDDEKVVYLWSFTNSRIGMAGIYRVSRRAMSLETGKSDGDLDRVLAALAEKRFCFYEDGVMWVRSRIKHLRMKGSKIAKSIRGDLEKLPGHPLVDRLREEYAATEWLWEMGSSDLLDPIDTPSIPHTSPIDTPSMGSGQGRAGQGRGKEETAGRAPEPPRTDALPDDLDDRLHPVAAAILPVLQRVADAKAAKPVTLAALGRTLAAEPDHDHIRVAGEFEHWWVHGHGAARPMRDVVLTFRKRLQDLPKDAAGSLASSARALNGAAPVMSRSERLRLARADKDRRIAEYTAEMERGAA